VPFDSGAEFFKIHNRIVILSKYCTGTSYRTVSNVCDALNKFLRQGEEVARQPVVEDYVFQWNGDVYEYAGQPLNSRESDTSFMAGKLAECFNEEDESESVLRCMEQVQGPWAFVFWHKRRRTLWFGRDFFGRQSLLLHQSAADAASIILSSCAPCDTEFHMAEVAANGLYRLRIGESNGQLELYPWDNINIVNMEMQQNIIISHRTLRCPVKLEDIVAAKPHIVSLDRELSAVKALDIFLKDDKIRELVMQLIDRLTQAVKLRVENNPGRCKNCIKEYFLSIISIPLHNI
jgi:asparagine synthetase B (glutamine-hydrolysing)